MRASSVVAETGMIVAGSAAMAIMTAMTAGEIQMTEIGAAEMVTATVTTGGGAAVTATMTGTTAGTDGIAVGTSTTGMTTGTMTATGVATATNRQHPIF